MEIKTADSRGRINLGKEFANKIFIFEKVGKTEMKLEIATVIPDKEIWFYRDPEAQKALFEAIGRVKAGEFADSPPDIIKEEPWEKELED
jgi:hypothetical protein